MQQKRMLEGQPKIITAVTTTTAGTTTTVVKNGGTMASGTILKTTGGMATLLSSGNVVKKITQMQPKTTGTGMCLWCAAYNFAHLVNNTT